MANGVSDIFARKPNHASYNALDGVGAGGRASPEFLALHGNQFQSALRYFDDFDRKALDATNRYTAGETGSGTAFATPGTIGLHGTVVGVTGTSSGNTETLRTAVRMWSGDYNCWAEARVQFDVITTLMFEFGFIDSASDLTLPVTNDIDTPSLLGGTSDVAILIMDTSQTLTTTAFLTDGSTSNMNTTAKTASPVFTPTAATYCTLLVGLAGDIPFAMINGGAPISGTGVIGQRIEGGTLLQPWLACRTRTTAAKTCTLDYLAMGQDRDVRVA